MAVAAQCAVVFKAYRWDEFVERQARRLAASAGALDFYILVDESGGAVGPIAFERVIRFTCADLEAAGLAMRFAVGGVLWWNPDYAHYQFLNQYPDYDNYLFVEYDCVVQGSLEAFVTSAVSQGADLVALPIQRSFAEWHWTPYQREVYSPEEVRLALLNVCYLSGAAIRLLYQRRLAMNAEAPGGDWPSSELFVPSELARAGMTWLSLADCGDVSHYDWFPPTLEDDLRPGAGATFLHPVLDRKRYIASLLFNRGCLRPGELEHALARFRLEEYWKLLWPAARQRMVRRVRHTLLRWQHQWAQQGA